MSDTEQLFVVAAVWVVIAAMLARLIPGWWGKGVFFAALVAVPLWELPYGYFNFQRLCTENANLKVVDKILPQDSVCIEHFDLNLYMALSNAGFARVELTDHTKVGKSYLNDGRLVLANRENPQSVYCLTFENNIHMPWRILRSDTSIRKARDGSIVGLLSGFYWIGMWWQERARPLLGRGGVCSRAWDAPIRVLREGTN